jgi:hypothetical protein
MIDAPVIRGTLARGLLSLSTGDCSVSVRTVISFLVTFEKMSTGKLGKNRVL